MHSHVKKKQYKSRVRTRVLDGQCNDAGGNWLKGCSNKSDKQIEMSYAGMAGGLANHKKGR